MRVYVNAREHVQNENISIARKHTHSDPHTHTMKRWKNKKKYKQRDKATHTSDIVVVVDDHYYYYYFMYLRAKRNKSLRTITKKN